MNLHVAIETANKRGLKTKQQLYTHPLTIMWGYQMDDMCWFVFLKDSFGLGAVTAVVVVSTNK